MQGFLGVNTAEVSPPPRDEVVEDMLDQSSESNNMQHNTTSITEENVIKMNDNKHIAPDKSDSHTGLQIRAHTEKIFFYFSTKTYIVGTQENRLNGTVLLSTQNACLNR